MNAAAHSGTPLPGDYDAVLQPPTGPSTASFSPSQLGDRPRPVSNASIAEANGSAIPARAADSSSAKGSPGLPLPPETGHKRPVAAISRSEDSEVAEEAIHGTQHHQGQQNVMEMPVHIPKASPSAIVVKQLQMVSFLKQYNASSEAASGGFPCQDSAAEVPALSAPTMRAVKSAFAPSTYKHDFFWPFQRTIHDHVTVNHPQTSVQHSIRPQANVQNPHADAGLTPFQSARALIVGTQRLTHRELLRDAQAEALKDQAMPGPASIDLQQTANHQGASMKGREPQGAAAAVQPPVTSSYTPALSSSLSRPGKGTGMSSPHEDNMTRLGADLLTGACCGVS